jgi:UDP-glucose 4-epimerase
MKILITGGNGYIAKSLYTKLNGSYDITCITRRDFDLTDYNQTFRWFADKHFDVVIHTAVSGGSRLVAADEGVIDRNLRMYYNLVSLEDHFDRFITFGSGAEITMPWEPYGFSKRIIAESMKKRDKYYNLRIRAVFDENELDTRFIKSNLLKYIKHEPMIIHQNKYMDFFYMEDLVSLVNYYIKAKDPIQDVDCCYNYNLTLSEIASYINTLDDHKVGIKIQTEGMSDAYVGTYLPVLSPLVGLSEGINRVYNKLKNSNGHL